MSSSANLPPPLPYRLGLTPLRGAQVSLSALAIGLLPAWARRIYGLPGLPPWRCPVVDHELEAVELHLPAAVQDALAEGAEVLELRLGPEGVLDGAADEGADGGDAEQVPQEFATAHEGASVPGASVAGGF